MGPAISDVRRKFLGIEIGRGVATLMVALHHAGIFVMQIDHVQAQPFGGVVLGFHVGVDFFFVLSGFLITWLHWSDIGNLKQLKGYLLRRFTRIYPAYWCVLIPLILVHFFAGRDSVSDIITSLFLIPAVHEPILGVGWTLVFEVFFYAGFGALIAGGRWAVFVLPIWVIAILVHYAVYGLGSFPAAFFLNLYDLEFITGMVVALILRATKIPFPGWFVAIGSLVFFGAAFLRIGTIISPECLEYRLIFGLSAGLAVLGIVELDRSGSFAYPKWLLIFGASSYSIYLAHSLIEVGVAKMLRPSADRISGDGLTLIIAAAGVISGIIFHLLVEKRITQKMSMLLFSRRSKLTLAPDVAVRASGNAAAVRLGKDH